MSQYLHVFSVRYLRLAVFLCVGLAALCLGDAGFAMTRAELYQATAPVTDRSEAAQSAAFQAAMKIVLVRVTGRRTVDDDPVFAPLIGNARRYVQQYRSAPDGQVWVSFDGPAIERWLTQNGQPLWGHERPTTFVWLTAQTGPQSGTVITADDTSELKAAIDAAAALRGLPLLWPSAADVQSNHLDYAGMQSTPPATLAVLNLDYVDTSGEPTDQTAVHQRRAADFVSALQRDLVASGQYRIVPMSCGSESCATLMNPSELQKAARAAGAKLVLLGGVHKMSTLVQWAKIQIADEEQGQVVFDRLLTFRGDTDEAWQKAESFVARDVLQSALAFGKHGDAIAPAKLAVFDFELEDFSGGAGLIPESDEDREQLRRATETARQLLTDSGRYSLVDVSRANAPDVTAHTLRKCDGCDAAIARQLGADQSLVGIVTRITRTDYAVTFKIRDARTGASIAVEQTDLRIGANYSWNRGAAWLIKNRLLEKQAQQ